MGLWELQNVCLLLSASAWRLLGPSIHSYCGCEIAVFKVSVDLVEKNVNRAN